MPHPKSQGKYYKIKKQKKIESNKQITFLFNKIYFCVHIMLSHYELNIIILFLRNSRFFVYFSKMQKRMKLVVEVKLVLANSTSLEEWHP